MENIFYDFRPPISTIISRSLVTASFNTEDRFDYDPSAGFKVKIPDRLAYVSFERAPAAELRDRVAFSSDPSSEAYRIPALPARSVAWWFAQLVHYGLPITPDQDQAQLSIKSAISRNQLVVPYRLRELEMKLKRQYEIHAANANAAKGGLQARHGKLSSQELRSTTIIGGQQTATNPITPKRKRTPFRTLSQSKFGVHTADEFHRSVQTSREDQSDSSDFDTSSAPNKDPTPKPGDLFTPNGTLITMPAEFPGIHTKEEIEARRQAHQKKIEEYRRNHKKNTVSIPSNTKIPMTTSDNTVAAESSSDAAEEGLDGEIQLVENLSAYLSERRKFNPIKTERSRTTHTTVPPEPDEDVDCDEDDVESLIFYTPMQFVKRYQNEEEDTNNEDDESVILYDVRPKLEKRSKSRNAQLSVNSNLKKNSKLGPKDVKHGKSTQEAKNKTVNNVPVSTANKVNKKSIKTKTSKSKKIENKLSDVPPPSRSSIWISSESDNEVSDGNEDEIAVAMKPQKQGQFMESLDENISRRSRSASNKLIPSLTALAATMTPLKRMLPPPTRGKTATTTILDNPVDPRGNGNSKKSQVSHVNAVQNLAIAANLASDMDNAQEEQDRKSKRQRRKELRTASGAQAQNLPDSSITTVKDFTGCGITEMSGALHLREEEDAVQPVPSVKAKKKFESANTNPRPKPLAVPKRSVHQLLSLETVDTDVDAESDVPSMRELFSSQETPANWKLTERRSRSKDPNAIEKSQGSKSTPFNKDTLTSLPAYLRTSTLNNSPELSKSSPIRPMARDAPSAADTYNQRKRVRSMSVGSLPHKRMRQSMMEIEAENTQDIARRQSSISSPHPDQIANIAEVLRTCDEVPPMAPSQRRLKRAPAVAKNELKRKVSALNQEIRSAKKGRELEADYEEPHEKRAARRKARNGESGRKRNKA